MSEHSNIAWTDASWNPVTGCTKVSAGCAHCYAERLTERLWPGRKFSEVRLHPERLETPLHWRRPRKIFVCSMSDLFHEMVSRFFIYDVFEVMAKTPQHTYQVLTKRPRGMMRFLAGEPETNRLAPYWCVRSGRIEWPLPNVQIMVSAEDQPTADERIGWLLQTPAAVRGVSLEPLLGPIDLSWYLLLRDSGHRDGSALSWVIVGGESGPHARPMELAWLESIVEQCQAAKVPVFVKQDSGRFPGKQGRIPDALWALKQFPNSP